MAAILLLGDDAFLLETRAAVLRTTGAEILTSDLSAALTYLEGRCFDIVILCHSIPTHVCYTLAGIIRQNWPATRVLRLSAAREWEESEALIGVDICLSQPQQLIEHTVMLLGHPAPCSVKTTVHGTQWRTGIIH